MLELNFMDTINSYIRKYPVVTSIFAIQILFIIFLIAKACITPANNFSVNTDLFITDSKNTCIKNGELLICNNGNFDKNNRLNVQTGDMFVHSGSYRVDINYNLTLNDNERKKSNVNITMLSRWKIVFDSVKLDDSHNIISGKLWVPFFTGCNDLKVRISYDGNGVLNVKSITLTESLPYRGIRIAGFIILFTLVDLGIMIFYTNAKIPVKKHHAILLLIIAVSSLPFCAGALFNGHDLWFHLRRIVTVSEELANGQFPVRMATELNNGYGYPSSIYYCDLFLYPVALLYSMSVPLRNCYQIYVLLINSATAVFSYQAIGKVTNNTSIKLIGTALYALCVYRLVNLNVRHAVGEYTAMTFLPLIVAGLYLIFTKEKPKFEDWSYLTFGISGVVLSHVVTGEMIAINILLLCFVLWKKIIKRDVFLSFVKAATLCIGITAFFTVPFFDYFIHHITIVQKGDLRLLGNSTSDLIFLFQQFAPENNEAHKTIGMPLTIGMGIILYSLVQFKNINFELKNIDLLRLISGFAFINFIFASTSFPWGKIQNYLGIDSIGYKIGTIQFSWRFLSISSILFVFSIVISLNIIEKNRIKNIKIICFGLLCSIIISVGFFYYKYTDNRVSITYNMVQPYLKSDLLYLLAGTDRSIENCSYPKVLSGNAIFSNYGKNGNIYKMYVENNDTVNATVFIPIYNYRYFNIYGKDGFMLEKGLGYKNCITASIPAHYKGDVIVKFEPPYLWRLAEVISILCLLGTILRVVFPFFFQRLHKN